MRARRSFVSGVPKSAVWIGVFLALSLSAPVPAQDEGDESDLPTPVIQETTNAPVGITDSIPAGFRLFDVQCPKSYIMPGDRVDVVGTFRNQEAKGVLRNVQVLAADGYTAPKEVPNSKLRVLQLLVTAEQVEALALANSMGTLDLILRSADEDTDEFDSGAPFLLWASRKARLGSEEPSFEEQTIYIPFKDLQSVFEKEGRGVFVPYEQFDLLWKKAREADFNANRREPQELPYDAMISTANNLATVSGDVMQVESVLTIQLLKPGWNTVPLRLKQAAIQSATIEGQAARIVPAQEGGFELLVYNALPDADVDEEAGEGIDDEAREGSAEDPQMQEQQEREIELKLNYVRAVRQSPGQNSVAFDAPQAAINRWEVRIAEPGVKIELSPMIAAATAEKDDASGEAPDGPNETNESVLLAFVGVAPEVQIRWNAKAEGATGLASLINVQTEQRALISKGALRTTAQLSFAISRAPMESIQLRVPAEHKVVRVVDSNIRKWSAEPVADNPQLQIIDIELYEPATGQQQLTVELEQFVNAGDMQDLPIPSIEAIGVVRQQGALVVGVDPNLRGESLEQSGLLQIDLEELPQRLKSQAWDFAFRFSAAPFLLRLALEERQPEIQAQQLVEARLQPEVMTLLSRTVYSIQRAGVYQLEMLVPEEFEILNVSGLGREVSVTPRQQVPLPQAPPAGMPVQPAKVDAYHLEDVEDPAANPGLKRLIVNLSKKAIGEVGLEVQMRKRLTEIDLNQPTSDPIAMPLILPRPNQAFLDQLRGAVLLIAPESLRVNTTEQIGLRSIAPNQAYGLLSQLQSIAPSPPNLPNEKVVLSLEYSSQPTGLTLAVERRAPYVSAKQFVLAKLEEGVFTYETTLEFDIRYSPVRQLSLLVPVLPDSTALRNVSRDLREEILSPTPDDTPDGFEVWHLTGDTELLGPHRVVLRAERKLDEIKIGDSLAIEVPQVQPLDVNIATGQVAINKTETFGISTPGAEGLRPIDPSHDLMPLASERTNLSRAFEFVGDWSLSVEATRYAEQEVKRTSIERGLVNAVVTRSGQISYQALYRLRTARQRLALAIPAEAEFAAQPVRINGQVVTLQRGDQDLLFVPVTNQDPEQEFVLELRYSMPQASSEITLPSFPEDPAVQKIYLALHLPEEKKLTIQRGPWTEEFDWRLKRGFEWQIANRKTNNKLLQWVKEGLNCGNSPAFQTDGTTYLYSSLKPAPPPDGNFGYTAVHRNTLALLVVLGLAAIGLLFLRSDLASKIQVLACVVAAVLLVGVFMPNLVRQCIGPLSLLTLFLVAVAWILASFLGWLRDVDWQAVLPRKAALAADAGVEFEEVPEEAPSGGDEGDGHQEEQGGEHHD